MKKQLVIFSIAIMLISAFFALPENYGWLKGKVFSYWNDFLLNRKYQDIEHRKILRWQTDYAYSKIITDSVSARTDPHKALVLMPPTNYFKQYGIRYHVPEPAVFYYYTGLKTIWPNSPRAAEANWFVLIRNGHLTVAPVIDKKVFQDTINAYKKPGVTLRVSWLLLS